MKGSNSNLCKGQFSKISCSFGWPMVAKNRAYAMNCCGWMNNKFQNEYLCAEMVIIPYPSTVVLTAHIDCAKYLFATMVTEHESLTNVHNLHEFTNANKYFQFSVSIDSKNDFMLLNSCSEWFWQIWNEICYFIRLLKSGGEMEN